MKTLAIAFTLAASFNSFAGVIYSNTADLSTSATQIKLDSAEYRLIPTKTETRWIPGCVATGERHPVDCEETVVLESQPVITVNVSYKDRTFQSEGNMKENLALNFRLEDFSAEEVETLKAAYPTWRNPFSTARRDFARNNFELQVVKAQRTIQVVDVRNSKLCPIMESGNPMPGCVERLAYKPAQTTVKEVTLLRK